MPTGPSPPSRDVRPRDRFAWTWSAAIGLVFAALVMAHSLWWMSVVHRSPGWWVPGDTWIIVEPGRYVANGALGYLYSADQGFLALPLSAILLAPAVWLSDHWNLVGGYPLPIAHPTSWLVVGPWELLAGIPALHSARRLAAGFGLRGGRLLAVQVWIVLTVLVPCAAWSHPEDVLAVAFLLYSLNAVREGRDRGAALFLAAAICSKQWSVVAVPFLLLGVREKVRKRILLWSLLPPVALAAFPLAVDWADASRALISPTVPMHLREGHYSLLIPLLTRVAGPHGSMLGRAVEFLAAPLVAFAVRNRVDAVRLAALGGVLLLRLFCEPVVLPYYLAPAAAVIGFACIAVTRRVPLAVMWWQTVLTVWLLLDSHRPGWWWSGAVVLVLSVAWAGWRPVHHHGDRYEPAYPGTPAVARTELVPAGAIRGPDG